MSLGTSRCASDVDDAPHATNFFAGAGMAGRLRAPETDVEAARGTCLIQYCRHRGWRWLTTLSRTRSEISAELLLDKLTVTQTQILLVPEPGHISEDPAARATGRRAGDQKSTSAALALGGGMVTTPASNSRAVPDRHRFQPARVNGDGWRFFPEIQ